LPSMKLARFENLAQHPVIGFVHLPRCGGTALADRFERGKSEDSFRAFGFPGVPSLDQIEYARSTASRCMIHGHMIFGADEDHDETWPYFTVLREPEARFVSEFFLNYNELPPVMRPEPHQAFNDFVNGLTFASFQSLLLATPARNLPLSGAMATPDFHAPMSEKILLELALENLNTRFFAVGLLDHMSSFVSDLATQLNVRPARASLTNSRDRPANFSLDNVPAARRRLRELLDVDFQLHDIVRDGQVVKRRRRPPAAAPTRRQDYFVFRDVKLGRAQPFNRQENGYLAPFPTDTVLTVEEGRREVLRESYLVAHGLKVEGPAILSMEMLPEVDLEVRLDSPLVLSVRGHDVAEWRPVAPGRYAALVPPTLFARSPAMISVRTLLPFTEGQRLPSLAHILKSFRVDRLPTVRWGQTLRFAAGRPETVHLIEGWGPETPHFVWSQGHQARIVLGLEGDSGAAPVAVRLRAKVHPFVATDKRKRQRVTVRQGQDRIAWASVWRPTELCGFTWARGAILAVELDLPDALTGKEMGLDLDGTNVMGVGLEWLVLDALPSLPLAGMARFNEGSDFTVGLGEGWKPPEASAVWAAATECGLMLALGPAGGQVRLSFHLSPLLKPGETSQSVTITLTADSPAAVGASGSPGRQKAARGEVSKTFELGGPGRCEIDVDAAQFCHRIVKVRFQSRTTSLRECGQGESGFPLAFQLLDVVMSRAPHPL